MRVKEVNMVIVVKVAILAVWLFVAFAVTTSGIDAVLDWLREGRV